MSENQDIESGAEYLGQQQGQHYQQIRGIMLSKIREHQESELEDMKELEQQEAEKKEL